MHDYLGQHSAIHMCDPDKEPSFYCDSYGVSDVAEYSSNFYGALATQLLGDASTPYLTCPRSAEMIAAANPTARILAIIRQPADRAYSLYLKMCSLGHETAATFEEALKNEARVAAEPPEWYRDGYQPHFLYFSSEQLQRYYERFPAESIRVVLFDDLVKDSTALCADIFRWLGLDPLPALVAEQSNKAVFPRSLKIQHWLRHSLNPFLRKCRFPYRASIVGKLQDWNVSPTPPPKLDKALRRALTERYAEDIAATAQLIGRDLGHWMA
jgi:hypothetical protein